MSDAGDSVSMECEDAASHEEILQRKVSRGAPDDGFSGTGERRELEVRASAWQ